MSLHIQCIMKNQLVRYYLNQAGRGSPNGGSVRTMPYNHSLNADMEYAGLSNHFRLVRPLLWSGVKAVGRESLRTGDNIPTEIADTDSKPRHIIAKHVG
jgi:hypothetical protein